MTKLTFEDLVVKVDLITTTKDLAEIMDSGGLPVFNTGCYIGTKIKIRQLTGSEQVRVVGTTAGAAIEADSWVVDRFGHVGARAVRRLLDRTP